MPSSQNTISYAAAAASALVPAPIPHMKEFQVKNENGASVSTRKDRVHIISQQSNDTGIEAIKLSAEKNTKPSCQTMQTDALSSHTPTSTSASVEGTDSHLTFASMTSSHDISAMDNDTMNASDKKKAAPFRPVLSILTGASLITKASENLSPLASVGSAKARPLSPPTVRESHFSHLFLKTEDVGSSDPPESPFFADGLSGGLITAMSDVEVQRKIIGENVQSYMTAHYASPSPIVIPQPGTEQWNEYIASLEAAEDALPTAATGTSTDLVQASTSTIDHGQRSRFISNLLLSAEKRDDDLVDKSTPAVYNPRIAPFMPRHTTTIESLEQVAENHHPGHDQRGPIVARPRPAWDQVSNWRTRVQGQDGTWPRRSNNRNWKPARDTRSQFAGAPGPSTTAPRNVTQLSSQALTITSQSSSSAHGAIGNRDDDNNRRRTFEVFRPMNAVLNPDAHLKPLSKGEIAYRIDHGISLNYHGNHVNPRNISANIPDKDNCAVWITNLPTRCTVRDLLQALMHHRPGRVWATVINPPEEPKHPHAAAKIVFYHPSEAKRFLDLVYQPGIIVQNRVLCAIYNKQRIPAQTHTYPTSRALEIRGDKSIVNEEFLRSLFEQHFRFEDEAVDVLAEFDKIRVLEWRFGSMRAQASAAYQLLERMYPCVDVRYATDPCAQYMIMRH